MALADSCPKYVLFQALASPVRLKMLNMLADEEMPVLAVSRHFNMTRPAVQKHLHVLAVAGLVSERKSGREMRYKLRREALLELKQWISQYEQS